MVEKYYRLLYLNANNYHYRVKLNFMKKAIYLLAPTILLGVSITRAEESVELNVVNKNIPDKIEDVHVWGTRVKSSSVFMGAADMDLKQADHISDLLRTIPGVDVGGAHSLNQRITIRSIEDRDISISIDGANQNNYMYHHMGNLQIHADILQTVEIDVGTNSVVHGGLGGSVRFETKQAKELLEPGQALGARIKGTGSTNGSNDMAASIYSELDNGIDLLVYYNHVQKNDYRVGGGEIKDNNGSIVANTDGNIRGLEGTVDSALLKTGWDINADHRLTLGYEYYQDKGDYSYRPDMGLATDSAISTGTGTPLLWPTEYIRNTITLNYDLSLGNNTELKAAVYDNNSSLWRDERGYAQSSIPRFQAWAGIVQGDANNYGVNLIATTNISTTNIEPRLTQKLTYGAEYVNYTTHYQADLTTGSINKSGEEKTDTAIYLQDKIALSNLLTLTPGIRYSNVDVKSSVVDETFNNTALALALEVKPSEAWIFQLSGTELFQAPELAEVFVGAGLWDTANPAIKAETGFNSEFSVAYNDGLPFTLGGTLFQTQINDYIYDYAVLDTSNPRATWKDNVGDVTINGYELYIGYELGNLDTLLTYSASDSKLKANANYSHYEGARLDRSQEDAISFKLGYTLDSINITFNWNFLVVGNLKAVNTDMQLDGAGSDNSKPGYDIHNISALWQVSEGLTLTLGIDNLFDEYYVSQSSRTGSSFHPVFGQLYLNDYEPGRNIKTNVAYKF